MTSSIFSFLQGEKTQRALSGLGGVLLWAVGSVAVMAVVWLVKAVLTLQRDFILLKAQQ